MKISTHLLLLYFILNCSVCFSQNPGFFLKANELEQSEEYSKYKKELYRLLAIRKELVSEENQAHLYAKLLDYYRKHEYNEDSIKYYYEVGSNFCNTTKNEEVANLLQLKWAEYLYDKGQFVESQKEFQQLEPAIQNSNYDFAPEYHDSYANLLFSLSDNDQAVHQLLLEVNSLQQNKEDKKLARVYRRLSDYYNSVNDLDFSISYSKKAIKIGEQLQDTVNLVDSYTQLGDAYLKQKKYILAEKQFNRALDFGEEWKTENLKKNYALILAEKGNFLDAEKLLLEVYIDPSTTEKKRDAIVELINIKISQNKYKDALFFQEKLNEVNEELFRNSKSKEIEQLKAEYQAKKNERELNSLREKNEDQQKIISRNRVLVLFSIIMTFLVVLASFLLVQNHLKSMHIESLKLQQQLLHSQMNPHFIFNALSNIQANILKQETDKAVSYLSKFSKLIRSNLENSLNRYILLSSEIEMLEGYLELQNIRFENKLNYTITIDPSLEVDLIRLPSMIIQPLVENAIEHGIMNTEQPIINIEFVDQDATINCIVTDNGIGYSNSLKKKTNANKKSISTKIIKERLHILSRRVKKKLQYSIQDIIDDGQNITGTKVQLELPIVTE